MKKKDNNCFYVLKLIIFCVLFFICAISYGRVSSPKDEGAELLKIFKKGLFVSAEGFELKESEYNDLIDYKRYGKFEGVGTENYRYIVAYETILKRITPPGVYPNDKSLMDLSAYKEFLKSDSAHMSFSEYLKHKDFKKSFYKIFQDNSLDPGERTVLTALVLEEAGHILPAINAYYAAIVYFPRSIVSFEQFGIKKSYAGQIAISSILRLTRDHPNLNVALDRASFIVENGDDMDMNNDIIKINPGELKTLIRDGRNKGIDFKKLKFKKEIKRGKFRIVQLQNDDWSLELNEKPIFIKGIYYNILNEGFSPLTNIDNLHYWMHEDSNNNAVIDAPFESWVDKDRNTIKDNKERFIGDFRLLKDIGINAIVVYANDNSSINKELLRELYDIYGIYVIIGDYLGAYTVGSGAVWQNGTDYTDEEQLKRMLKSAEDKVNYWKDEPFVLMWLLGYGNNMPISVSGINAVRTNANQHPAEYAKFIDSVAKRIHEIDPDHLVAFSNFDINDLHYFAEYSGNIDIVGINTNRGYYGFSTLWEDAGRLFDRPVLITRFGPDVYKEGESFNEADQLKYYVNNFRDIVFNQADGGYSGNSIGGILSEFADYPWGDALKSTDSENMRKEESLYRKEIEYSLSFNGRYGLVSDGKGKNILMRTLKEEYDYFKKINDLIKNIPINKGD